MDFIERPGGAPFRLRSSIWGISASGILPYSRFLSTLPADHACVS